MKISKQPSLYHFLNNKKCNKRAFCEHLKSQCEVCLLDYCYNELYINVINKGITGTSVSSGYALKNAKIINYYENKKHIR